MIIDDEDEYNEDEHSESEEEDYDTGDYEIDEEQPMEGETLEENTTEDNSLHSRFKGAPWYPKEYTSLLIGGAGGIGSWLALFLTRGGFNVWIFDMDTIETHNIGGQFFKSSQVGSKKVIALMSNIKLFTDVDIDVSDKRIEKGCMVDQYVFSAFDNMQARKDLFEAWRDNYGNNPDAVFIDGRLQAEHLQILCVRGADREAIATYERVYLFADSEVIEAPCTMKQTTHSAAMIASHMMGFFTNHLTNVVSKSQMRAVPFYWEYFIPIDFLEIQRL